MHLLRRLRMLVLGAITDKSFILNVIDMIKRASATPSTRSLPVAPLFPAPVYLCQAGQVITGLKELGFYTVIEAALGADMVAQAESRELAEKGFLTSSCCPAFVDYVHKAFPSLIPFVSHNPPHDGDCPLHQGA